jgi:WD40 repeat protein
VKINAISGVYTIKLLSNKKHIASGHADSKIRIWDVATGKLLNTLGDHVKKIFRLEIIDSELLVSSSDYYTIVIWNLSTRKIFKTLLGHTGQIWSLVYYSQMNMLISAADDTTIRQWDMANYKLITILDAHESYIYGIDLICHKEDIFVTCSIDGTIKYWRISTGELLSTIENGLSNQAVISY